MKSFTIVLLSCSLALAADDIRVITTAKTNAQSGAVTTKEFYMRGEQTNLVRYSKTKAGAVQICIHRFYRDGALVGDYLATPDSSTFTTEAGTPFSVSFEHRANKDVKAAVIASKNGEILDAFTFTNGVFTPVESLQLRKMNATSDAVRAETERFKRE